MVETSHLFHGGDIKDTPESLISFQHSLNKVNINQAFSEPRITNPDDVKLNKSTSRERGK